MAVGVTGNDSLKFVAELDNEQFKKKAKELEASINSAAVAGVAGAKKQDEAIRAQIGSIERLKIQLASYQNIAAKSTDPLRLKEYNGKIQALEGEISRMTNVGKKGFDELGNAIKNNGNIATKAFSSLRLIANILPGIGLFGILAFAIEPIMKYITSLDLFSKKIAEFVQTRKLLGDAQLKGAQDAQGEITTLKILYAQYQNANLPLKQRKEAYEEIQKLYPDQFAAMKFEREATDKTKAAYDGLTNSIIATARARAAADIITENSTRQLDNERKIADIETENNKRETANAKLKAKLSDPAEIQNARFIANQMVGIEKAIAKDLKTQRDLKTDSNILNKRNLALETQINKEIEKGAKITGKVGGDAPKPTKAIQNDPSIKIKEALERRILDIEAEYTRKSKSKDEEELQAVRDKFIKISAEVIKFNSDPKNKYKVNGSGLKRTEELAIADLTYRQDTERLKIKLDVDKKLYADYEAYRASFGTEAAKVRFEKELDLSKTYLQKLQEQVVANPITPKEIERNEGIQKQIDAELKAEQDKNDKLLLKYLSYEADRKKIVEQSIEEANRLRKLGDEKGALLAIENGKSLLTAVDNKNIQELDSYKALFDGLVQLSRKKTQSLINELQKELNARKAANTITVDAAQRTQAEIDKLQGSLSDALSDDLFKAAAALDRIASEVSGIDDNFGALLSTISKVVSGFGEIKKQKAAYDKASEDGDTFGKVLAGAGIVGAALGILNSVFGYFKGLKEAAKQARKETEAFYATAAEGEREYQALLRERARKNAADHATTLAQITAEQNLLKGQGTDITAQANKLLTELQRQQFVESTDYKHGTWFRKAKTVQNMGSLAGKSFEEIEQLALQGKLTESAKALYEELKRLKEEGVNVEEALIAAGNAAAELATGTNVDSLSANIINGLKEGKTGLADVMSDYADIIQGALLSTFESEVVKKELKMFYAKLSAAAQSDGIITADEKDALAKEYAEMRERIQKEADAYESVTGTSFTDPLKPGTSSGNSLSGAIKGITETQADLLAGQFGGLRLTALNQLQVATQQLDIQRKIETNTARLHDVVPILKAIQTAAEKNSGVVAANGRVV